MPLRALTGTPIPAAPPPAPGAILAIPYFRQQQINWCWAACTEMILHLYGNTGVQQCDMATAQFGALCCNTPSSSVCNRGAWPEHALARAGIVSTKIAGSYPVVSIQAEIAAGRPLIVYYAWTGGGAHVAVIAGDHPSGDLEVFDPWYGPGPRSYGAVNSAYGMGVWSISYYGIR